jgi:hypothetical protein
MRSRLVSVVVLVLVVGTGLGLAWKYHDSTRVRRERLVRDFLAVLPDSLDSEHRLEIQQLFYLFYVRADKGLVAKEDVDAVTKRLADYVDRRRITASELVHFMAEVGYTTYKGEPRYNLSDGSVDHPILNPASATYPLRLDSTQFDSTFWTEFEEWKETQPSPRDSAFWADSVMQELLKGIRVDQR